MNCMNKDTTNIWGPSGKSLKPDDFPIGCRGGVRSNAGGMMIMLFILSNWFEKYNFNWTDKKNQRRRMEKSYTIFYIKKSNAGFSPDQCKGSLVRLPEDSPQFKIAGSIYTRPMTISEITKTIANDGPAIIDIQLNANYLDIMSC